MCNVIESSTLFHFFPQVNQIYLFLLLPSKSQVIVAPQIGLIRLKMFRFLLFVLNYNDVLFSSVDVSKVEYGLTNIPQIEQPNPDTGKLLSEDNL